jgi:hypothetical protein
MDKPNTQKELTPVTGPKQEIDLPLSSHKVKIVYEWCDKGSKEIKVSHKLEFQSHPENSNLA